MSKDKYDSKIDFNRLMARNKHLEKMVSRYKQSEEWENLREGDAVIIDNSDSLHDGLIGKFLAHDWAIAGYVRLIVAFPDGKHCYYLPNQVVKVYDEPIAPEPATTAEPLTIEDFAPVTVAPEPQPERKGIDFSKFTPERVKAENERIVEAKLAQVAKMPESVRKKVLSSTLPSGLVPQALELAVKRGIIPAF